MRSKVPRFQTFQVEGRPAICGLCLSYRSKRNHRTALQEAFRLAPSSDRRSLETPEIRAARVVHALLLAFDHRRCTRTYGWQRHTMTNAAAAPSPPAPSCRLRPHDRSEFLYGDTGTTGQVQPPLTDPSRKQCAKSWDECLLRLRAVKLEAREATFGVSGFLTGALSRDVVRKYCKLLTLNAF